MAKTYQALAPDLVQIIEDLMKQSTSVWEYRRLQCVLLRRYALSAQQVSCIVGLHEGSVFRIWSLYLNKGIDALLGEKRGKVRGNAHLNVDEEEKLLAPFEKKAAKGHLTIAQEIHTAHCKKVGKDLHETVTYRMLKRHGWRKVVPRPHHPKPNKEDLDNFQVFFPQDSNAGEDRSIATWTPIPSDVSG